MKQQNFTRPAALLHLALLLAACGGTSGASATTMHLKRSRAPWVWADDEGKEPPPARGNVLPPGSRTERTGTGTSRRKNKKHPKNSKIQSERNNQPWA